MKAQKETTFRTVFDEIKEVIDVKIVINEAQLADKLFEKAVDPVMQKLIEIIPTEFDNLLYAAKKSELKALFLEALQKGVDVLEEESGMDLDGKEEEEEV
ncbi:MAG: hypothetical protein KAS32_31255 [Candidatus Peribacteraceae bacterium]|nr:hypothetical protein [Candidatus Peribacteraceae bacterium]